MHGVGAPFPVGACCFLERGPFCACRESLTDSFRACVYMAHPRRAVHCISCAKLCPARRATGVL
eukprot:7389618-Prymnesium_polylepis.1